MERKKRSKSSVWEFYYANKIFGTFGVEMRSFGGQKLVKFCTLTHTHTIAAKLVVRFQHTCDFGDGDISRCRSRLPHGQTVISLARL